VPVTARDDRREAARARAAAGDLLTAADLGAIWGLSLSAVYARIARGDFDPFRVQPAIGAHAFSGARVWRYLQGEALDAPAPTAVPFGKPRRRAS
jgi:hypothetical protein